MLLHRHISLNRNFPSFINENIYDYIIPIKTNSYEYLFSPWDHNPLKYRRVNPDLLNYILHCSNKIHWRKRRALFIYLPFSLKDSSKERDVISALKYCFYYYSKSIEMKIVENIIYSFLYILIGISIIATILSLSSIFFISTLFTFSFVIAGIFLWHGLIQKLLLDNLLPIRRYNSFKRLNKIHIIFSYK